MYAYDHEKNRSIVTIVRYVSFAYDSVLAINSMCPVSMNRQRKLKDGKLKKQVSTYEITASVEEAKEPASKWKRMDNGMRMYKTVKTENCWSYCCCEKKRI